MYDFPIPPDAIALLEADGWQNEPGFKSNQRYTKLSGPNDMIFTTVTMFGDGPKFTLSRSGSFYIHEYLPVSVGDVHNFPDGIDWATKSAERIIGNLTS